MNNKGLNNINFSQIKGLSKQEINILNAIKERIENGKSAYKKGWSNVSLNNMNYSTKNSYHGLNALSLAVAKEEKEYKSFSWLTFNQMNKLNEKIEKENKKLKVDEQKARIHLKRGSVGEKISFPVIYDRKNKKYLTYEEFNNISELEKDKRINDRDIIFSKKEFTVFNGDCFDNLDLSYEKELLENLQKNKVEFKDKNLAVNLCKSMGVSLSFRNQDKAFYIPEADKIVLPSEEQFYSNNLFKRTFFHELSHSTGNEKRLNRDLSGSFGSEKYAFEEIVAETSGIFLSEKFDYFYDENINISADYLKNWSENLINNPKSIIEALKKASEAKEYIEKHFEQLEKTLEKNVIIEEEKMVEVLNEEFETEEIELEMEM
ncbi:MAG: zincin-like metallopeptidase domain-containing protein [Parvimonas sp.]|uniref:zincin-like metallopeptidase domain-containing protein n=1 Tax=Parvimonas sp. TaxID=1944660 RepID=UPI002A758B5D|nr:zincin-like metallopeptidase domain-containing protein [Parvimonas sp.]MDY3050719.1 zincin-like metallopeptidase domain-containing protein [Parvimonas sp.]